MAQTIMLSGPHGIGKTETAKKVCSQLTDAMFMPSIAGLVAKQLNYDLNKKPTLNEVIAYQETMLDSVLFMYEATELVDTVYDRSPLDLATYLTMKLRDYPEYDKTLLSYVERAVELTKKHCDILVLPQADLSLPYDDKGNRPSFGDDQLLYRSDYRDILDALADEVSPMINVIDVPMEYQYEDRVQYIMDRIVV